MSDTSKKTSTAWAALSFRPVRPDDESFLYDLYSSTRQEELELLDWDEAQKTSFLQQRFSAQHEFYQQHYADADFLIVLLNAVPIGRLYIARRKDEIRLIEIALLPAYRNIGLGGAILRDILAEATAAEKPVRLYLEKLNPFVRLYQRLRFTAIGDKGVYLFLEWSPARVAKTTSSRRVLSSTSFGTGKVKIRRGLRE